MTDPGGRIPEGRLAEWREREAGLDRAGMRGHIAEFPGQLADGTQRAARFASGLPRSNHPPSTIAVVGMGGSAIGGDLVAGYTAPRRRVPLTVHRGYGLPAGIDDRAVVVASSYSGNTEETLSSYEEARTRGLRTIAVTTGGRLGDLAREAGEPVLTLPPGYPPRAALGHSFAACALTVARLDPGLDLAAEADALGRAVEAFRPAMSGWLEWNSDNPALGIAASAAGRLPVIHAGHAAASAAGRRWKAQLNENGKIPAWTSELPEHNHNEIVGFAADHPLQRWFCLIYLETPWDHPRVSRRIDFVHGYCAEKVDVQHRIMAAGATPLEGMLWLCALGDCASFLVSIIVGQDPTPVAPIDGLKRALED